MDLKVVIFSWDSILMFTSLMVMCLSTYHARQLTKKICNEKSKRSWKIMVIMISLFAGAYSILLLATLGGAYLNIAKLTNLVLLGGSAFVFLAVRVSSQMNEQILNYIQNLEDLVYKRTQELKQSQELIIEQQINLAYSSKMSALGEMAGGIAHEINNPLTTISSTCSFLKKLIEKEKLDPIIATKSLNDIEKTITRIAKIIQGLRTVSRDTSGEEFTVVKLRDMMDDVTGLCSEKFKNHGVNLMIDLNDPVFDQNIECRRIQVSQIFINLLGNAYDAIENLPDKWIKIECMNLNENIQFKIMDCGQGVPKEIQEKVFQPFFTTKPIGKGTGLGLSLSLSIVKDHNGTFTIDNAPSNTCFVISLPSTRKAA